jgi:hypothetical protein
MAAGLRRNLAVVLIVALAHAGLAVSYRADAFDLPATHFYPPAHAVVHGADAYGQLHYEYPPATLPLLVAPLAAGDDGSGKTYYRHTMWLYGLLDVACVLVIGFLLRRRPQREVVLALGLYSVGVIALGRLALTRFDLAAGLAILLAASAPRGSGRAGAWLGLAGALKLAPLAAAPALAPRGSTRRVLVAAAAVPIGAQIAYALWSGESGLSFLGYHSGRNPETESWAALLVDGARALGADAGMSFDHGSWNVTGGLARVLSPLFAVAAVAMAWLLAWRARRVGAEPALALLAAVTLLVTLAPVLSPQYLLWLVPLSALLAPRYPLQAVLLALAVVVTRLELLYAFDDLQRFAPGAVALLAARNLLLVAVSLALWRAATDRRAPASRQVAHGPGRWLTARRARVGA